MLIRAVDLFCGAGGLSKATIDAARQRGHKLDLVAVNHWDTAINSHSLNHPTVRHICEPVENLVPSTVVPMRHLHLLTAGVECTFHSNARGGGPCNEQSRSQAWQLIRWCTDIRVDSLLVENVREFMKWGPLYPCTCGAFDRWKRDAARRDLKRAGGARATPPTLPSLKHREGFKCFEPIPERKGEFFENFLSALRRLNYHLEHDIKCAADFGDPTSRERFLLLARLGRNIKWPKRTHFDPTLPENKGRKPWRTARECIDWSLEGQSVFTRKKKLCQNTVNRIIAGLKKFGGPNAEPFIAILNGTSESHINSSAQSLDRPLGSVTGSNRFYLVDGKLIPVGGDIPAFVIGQQSGATPRTTDKPLPTIATAGAIRLVKPFIQHLTHHGSDKNRVHSLDKPLPTVTGAHRGEMALVQTFMVQVNHGNDKKKRGKESRRAKDLGKPMPTITTSPGLALIVPTFKEWYADTKNYGGTREEYDQIYGDGQLPEAFIIPKQSKDKPRSLRKPMATITTKTGPTLVESFILPPEGFYRGNTAKSLKQPLPTITASRGRAFQFVEPIITQTDQTGGNGSYCRPVSKPIGTVVSKQNMLLVEPMIVKYYGTGVAKTTGEPLDTVTTRDRFLLVECGTKRPVAELDIRTRMLQPHELLKAHSLDGYILTGTKEDQTAQVGNSVPKMLGQAHVRVLLP